jgi:hypothetical protein
MSDSDVEFTFSDEETGTLITILEEEGASSVEEVAEQDFLPVVGVIVAAVIGLDALVNVVIKLMRVWKCGLIVDARGSIVRTEKNCDLPRGSVLVLTSDGTEHKLHEPKQENIAALIKAAS